MQRYCGVTGRWMVLGRRYKSGVVGAGLDDRGGGGDSSRRSYTDGCRCWPGNCGDSILSRLGISRISAVARWVITIAVYANCWLFMEDCAVSGVVVACALNALYLAVTLLIFSWQHVCSL